MNSKQYFVVIAYRHDTSLGPVYSLTNAPARANEGLALCDPDLLSQKSSKNLSLDHIILGIGERGFTLLPSIRSSKEEQDKQMAYLLDLKELGDVEQLYQAFGYVNTRVIPSGLEDVSSKWTAEVAILAAPNRVSSMVTHRRQLDQVAGMTMEELMRVHGEVIRDYSRIAKDLAANKPSKLGLTSSLIYGSELLKTIVRCRALVQQAGSRFAATKQIMGYDHLIQDEIDLDRASAGKLLSLVNSELSRRKREG